MAAADQTAVIRPPRVLRGKAKDATPKPQTEDAESTTRKQAVPASEVSGHPGGQARHRTPPRGTPAPLFPPLQVNRITEKLSSPRQQCHDATRAAAPRSGKDGRGAGAQPGPARAPTPEAPLPIPQQETRLIERKTHWSAELVALLGSVLRKDRVLELLQGLAAPQRGPALGLARHLLALDSGTRKARLAREFGERLDGSIRLRSVMAGCGGLEADMWRRLPPHHQRSYPRLQGVSEAVPNPVRAVLLERLIKETLR